MTIQKQFTVIEMRKILTEHGYEMVSLNSSHEKWKKDGCFDVVIPNSK